MTPLNKKLSRDLWRLRGQGLAISLVVAAGISLMVGMFGTLVSLEESRHAFYDRYRFAQVFAGVKRAPEILINRIRQIPGVASAETRIVADVTLDIAGMSEPATGRLLSLPERGRPLLNDIYLKAGRTIDRNRRDEAIMSESLAEAHGLAPGDEVAVIINGKKRWLDIVGVALTPEYIYSLGPGQIMPDNKRFGILWMGRKALEAAFDLEGAFNSLSVSLLRGASEPEVIRRLDLLLDVYGGVGAFGRKDQVSDFFLANELKMIRTFGSVIPPIFLGVAAFLLNIVITRLVQTEREQIGLLKAFGYGDMEVGWHYLKLVGALTVAGLVLGLVAGYFFGQLLTNLYTEYFRFPLLEYRVDPAVFSVTAGISVLAGAIGGLNAVRQAIGLSPAVAMAPPVPMRFRAGAFSILAKALRLSQPTRMIFRHLTRWPLRTAMSIAGIAFSVALMILALFFLDSVERLIDVYFFQAQRQHVTVTFVEPRPGRVEEEIRHLPGVLATQPARTVAARLKNGPYEKRQSITGIVPGADLNRLLDRDVRPVEPPAGGIALSKKIAQDLRVGIGDPVRVEVLQGRRPVADIPVTQIVEEYMGFSTYMSLDALNRFMGEGPTVSEIYLLVDAEAADALYERLKDTPAVAGVIQRKAALQSFRNTMEETMFVQIFFYVVFSSMIAFGVSYNSARIALSERSRTLASLRVLGFTRAEVAYILLGELALMTLLALPVGAAMGYAVVWLMSPMLNTDMYQFPAVIEVSTYAYSLMVVLVSAVVCWWMIRQRLMKLDLIAVLKTRE